MLTVLEHQIVALGREALSQYEDRLVARLIARVPAARTLGEGALRERVRVGVEDAVRRGITAENDVSRHVERSLAGAAPVAAPRGAEPASARDAEGAPPERRRRADGPRPRQVGSPVQPCLGWIEIVLTDDEGEPIPDERYVVELPDGTRREGAVDGRGRAYLFGIEPGTCQVSFPDLEVEKG